MPNVFINSANLEATANAIRTRSGTAQPLYVRDMPDAILAIPGGEPITEKDVNFFDYDGTLLHAWTLADAQAALTLPSPPAHPRLLFQEWNWTLEQIKLVAGPVNVAAIYVTESGKSEFDITLNRVTGLSVSITVTNVSGTLTVSWGDSTEDSTEATGAQTLSHTYAAYGDYTISVDSTGTYNLVGSSSAPYNILSNAYICTSIHLGLRCSFSGSYQFRESLSLLTITIPKEVSTNSTGLFRTCRALKFIGLPSTSLSIINIFAQDCNTLRGVSIPNTFSNIPNNAFQGLHGVKRFVIPSSITNISVQSFDGNVNVREYVMLPTTPPSLYGQNSFGFINSQCKILVPKGSLDAYRNATNWTIFADYMHEMEA